MPRFSPKLFYRWTLAALAETAVAVPWMVLVYAASGHSDWPEALPGAWLLLLTYAMAAAWELGSPESARGSGSGRVAAMGIGMAVVYLIAFYTTPVRLAGLSPWSGNIAMAVLPAAGYLWYQGAASGAEGVEYGRVFTRFGLQCIVTVGAVVLLVYTGVAREPRAHLLLYWSLLLLFVSGLTLLVITRERALRQDQARLGESGSGGERMSGLLTGVVVGLVVLTLLASYLVTPERMSAFWSIVRGTLGRPFGWLLDVGLLIVIRWAMMVSVLLEWLFTTFTRPPQGTEAPPMAEGEQPPEQPLLPVAEPPLQVVDWMPYLKVGLMAVGGVVLVVMLLRLRQRRNLGSGDPDEERVDLGLWKGLKGDLQGLLASLRSGTAGGDAASRTAVTSDDPRDPRALYRRFQQWGSEIGRPRGSAETPARYGEVLAERRPEAAEVTDRVTELYQQARYGPDAPSSEAVEKAADALRTLQK